LRGTTHPTAKAGFQASDSSASPTGLEIGDLLAEAVQNIRSNEKLIDKCVEDGLAFTIFMEQDFGSKP